MSNTVILGSRGNLSKSLVRRYHHFSKSSGIPLVIDGQLDEILDKLRSLDSRTIEKPLFILNTIGAIDWTGLSSNELNYVNVEFPLLLLEIAKRHSAVLITFGTVMENFPEYADANPYLKSKKTLSDCLLNQGSKAPFLNVRLHTLYGGPKLHKNLFLGKLFACLHEGRVFEMSDGMQLREYHHVDDDSVAIYKLIGSGILGNFNLSHGHPTRLVDIAIHLAKLIGREELISIGELMRNPHDNDSVYFKKPAVLNDIVFRDALDGIEEYFNWWRGQ